MPTRAALDAVIPATLPEDDRAFLTAWLSQAGDCATQAGLRGRVQAILGLQAAHPDHPPLARLVDDPLVRSMLLAKPGNRTGLRRQWKRHGGRT